MHLRSTAAVLCLSTVVGLSQSGDKRGEEQQPLPEHWQIPPAPILEPAEALKSFQLAENSLSIELFAAEPMVQDPVAIDFDADGRCWVVEMRGYMPDIDGNGEDEPVGRIRILEDTDRDGRADRATVFLDGLVMPRAIHTCYGGALFASNGQLMFARDTDGDLVADEREVVDADYIESGNPEHQPNGLLPGLDNWIYSAKSDLRYRRINGSWVREETEFRGQWGITEDHTGRLYYNVNYSQLHADFFPPNDSLQNPFHQPSHAVNRQIATNQFVFTLRPNPGVNRGYRPGVLDDRGYLREFTSACAPLVDTGTWLLSPDALTGQWDVFVCDPAANLVKRNRVTAEGHGLKSRFVYPDREFLVSTDERFRPVALANGPDGALYVVDLYRGIIQHRQYMTTHLRGQILSRDLDRGIHYGRIWRVHNRLATPSNVESLYNRPSGEWVALLAHPNGRTRNAARRLIVESGEASLIPSLMEVVAGSQSTHASIQALWAVEGLLADGFESEGETVILEYGGLSSSLWTELLEVASCDRMLVAVQALRILKLLASGSSEREAQLLSNIRESNLAAQPEAWLQVALTAGALRHPDTGSILAEILARGAASPAVRDAVLCATPGREPFILKTLLEDERWKVFDEGRDVALQALASVIVRQRDAAAIESLFQYAASQKGVMFWRQKPLLDGVLQNERELKRRPLKFASGLDALETLLASDDPSVRSAAERISSFCDRPGHPVQVVETPPLRPLTGWRAQHAAQGRELYRRACAACHGMNGEGLPNLAPPLVESEWLQGPVERIALIIAQGMEGPITVNGELYEPPRILPNMPAVDSLTDLEISAIVTFVRREFGLRSGMMDGDDVTIVRHRYHRETPWTPEELLSIE